MKRIVSVLLALAVLAVLPILSTTSKHGVQAVYAQSGCSAATLKGNYAFTFNGFVVNNNTSQPFYGEGLGTFDASAGNFSATFVSSFNGASSTGNPYTATYTVNSDCTGLLAATPGSGGDSFAFVILDDGAEVFATDISAPTTLNVHFKKQRHE